MINRFRLKEKYIVITNIFFKLDPPPPTPIRKLKQDGILAHKPSFQRKLGFLEYCKRVGPQLYYH